jgi:ribose-phosphate pyrophosphokinase
MNGCSIFAGSASTELAAAIAGELGVSLSARTVEHFPDGEVSVHLDESVRGHEVFIVQSTSPPVNDHLVELLVFADACRRAAADRVTAVVPYFGYARSDKRQGLRRPITASAVADWMRSAGINHLLTVDVHTPQLEGFFRIPVDDLTTVPLLCDSLREEIAGDAVVVTPDLGGVRRATEYARLLGLPVAVCHKHRVSGTEVKVTDITGDVRGRACVIVDDMISTGGTIAEGIRALAAAGARPAFTVAATHGVFVEGAYARLVDAGVRTVYITNTIAIADREWPPLRVVSVAPLIAAALRRVIANGSLADLH